MKEKKYKDLGNKDILAKEPIMMYQRNLSDNGVTRMISKAALQQECLSLEESKNKILDKVHRHFQ